jgi:hypothetical protein
MFTTFINDCKDDNARSRQESRVGSLFPTSLSFIGVDSDIEASMQLIDILDATEGREGLILVNVAPRGGHTVQWENGTPFGYFYYGKTLIISSVDGYSLSAVKKLGLFDSVQLLDAHTSADAMQAVGFVTADAAAHIPNTQFRSFDFIPRAGVFMMLGNTLPSETYSLEQVPDLPAAVWHIDSFGNCKTTLLPEEIQTVGTTTTRFGVLPYIERLRDVSDGSVALVRGSSGLQTHRFIEIMAQRGNFALHHEVKIGDDVFAEKSYFKQATV